MTFEIGSVSGPKLLSLVNFAGSEPQDVLLIGSFVYVAGPTGVEILRLDETGQLTKTNKINSVGLSLARSGNILFIAGGRAACFRLMFRSGESINNE